MEYVERISEYVDGEETFYTRMFRKRPLPGAIVNGKFKKKYVKFRIISSEKREVTLGPSHRTKTMDRYVTRWISKMEKI